MQLNLVRSERENPLGWILVSLTIDGLILPSEYQPLFFSNVSSDHVSSILLICSSRLLTMTEANPHALSTNKKRRGVIHASLTVWIILEAPSLKDGSGKELCCLHDAALQHLRALKVVGHEPSGSFITSVLELSN